MKFCIWQRSIHFPLDLFCHPLHSNPYLIIPFSSAWSGSTANFMDVGYACRSMARTSAPWVMRWWREPLDLWMAWRDLPGGVLSASWKCYQKRFMAHEVLSFVPACPLGRSCGKRILLGWPNSTIIKIRASPYYGCHWDNTENYPISILPFI